MTAPTYRGNDDGILPNDAAMLPKSKSRGNKLVDDFEQFKTLIAENYDASTAESLTRNAPRGRIASPEATTVVSRAVGKAQPATRTYGPRDWPASDDVVALEEAETHFIAPNPKDAMSAVDPIRRLAIIGAVALPLVAIGALVLQAAIGWDFFRNWMAWVLGVLFILCLGVLLRKLPDEPRDGTGAVV
jgi:hypothetical protein